MNCQKKKKSDREREGNKVKNSSIDPKDFDKYAVQFIIYLFNKYFLFIFEKMANKARLTARME